MQTAFVKPAPNPEAASDPQSPAFYSIRDPDLKDFIPEGGRLVPLTDYWLRRIRDKDVLVTAEPKSAAK